MSFTSEILGLSIAHWLVLLSAVLSVVGSGAYIRDTLKGTTKPNRVSFSMWALLLLSETALHLCLQYEKRGITRKQKPVWRTS
jgi:hypothetical protein